MVQVYNRSMDDDWAEALETLQYPGTRLHALQGWARALDSAAQRQLRLLRGETPEQLREPDPRGLRTYPVSRPVVRHEVSGQAVHDRG